MKSEKYLLYLVLLVGLVLTIACAGTTAAPTATPTTPVPTDPPALSTPTTPPDPTATSTPIPDEALKILFIGNSFTFFYNMPDIFATMMEAGGHPVFMQVAAEPGYQLWQHLESKDTLAAIDAQEWDYIVLQENSHNLKSDRTLTQNMYPSVRQLDALIDARGAQTVLFLTWADKYSFSDKGYASLAEMQQDITGGYSQIADEVGAEVAPAGPAWLAAYGQHPELELWDGDANHPSELGAYLNACVFYAFFTQTSPEESGYAHSLPPETARMLQAAAAEVVLGRP